MEDKLFKKLIAMNYSEASAKKTASDLLDIQDPDIKRALECWIKYSRKTIVKEEEYSTECLMQRFRMTYPAALIFINWYRENPREAISTLRIRM